MRWLKALAMFLLLATWLSSSNHCYLEVAGFLPPDECHSDEEASSSSKGDPCENGCKITEEAGYKTQDNSRLAVLIAVLSPVLLQFIAQNDSPPQQVLGITAWPPDTLYLQHFLVRTSLPIRGPSVVS